VDPLFVSPGTFAFDRWEILLVENREYSVPDFVIVPPDYSLDEGSPCVDTGTTEDSVTTDLEGNGRPCSVGPDMGAYERGGCAPPTTALRRGDTNADSTLDIADAVFTLMYLFAVGQAPTCLDSADTNDDGTIDLADAIAALSHLFADTGDLPAPFGECGIDPTADTLDCSRYAPCE
jgi:hypothetical protein